MNKARIWETSGTNGGQPILRRQGITMSKARQSKTGQRAICIKHRRIETRPAHSGRQSDLQILRSQPASPTSATRAISGADRTHKVRKKSADCLRYSVLRWSKTMLDSAKSQKITLTIALNAQPAGDFNAYALPTHCLHAGRFAALRTRHSPQ